jgi:hypothetical protein
MADSDIQITAGSGTKVDTRTVGTGADEHRQVVVIGDPTTAAEVAVVTAANGLKVDVTRIIPGVLPNNLGKQEDQQHNDGDTGVLMLGVRNHLSGSTADGDYSALSVSSTGDLHTIGRRDVQRIQVTVPGTVVAPYAAGDQMGTIISLSNAVRVSGGTGTVVGVALQSFSDTIGAVDVVFFDSTVTLALNNDPFVIADADILDVVGVVSLAGAYDIGNNRICQAFNLAMPYWCSGSTTLYAALLVRTGFTPAADFTTYLTVFVERN